VTAPPPLSLFKDSSERTRTTIGPGKLAGKEEIFLLTTTTTRRKVIYYCKQNKEKLVF